MSRFGDVEMERRNTEARERRLCVPVPTGFLGGKMTAPNHLARRPDGCDAFS